LNYGEDLIADHIAQGYKKTVSNVRDTFSNFSSRFNTVAKLNNFTYTMEQVEQIGKDMAIVKTILEYDTFKNDCAADVGYMMNLEQIESLPAALKDTISDAKRTSVNP
jgi:methyl coenzyme M reductase alpha subunit